ncbi:titin isoform X2 [Pectinophora gossypiella]|uniref:titin isoform X2 n=1 Tax=Pectinophora gossypiella TaxID=13191 RepID=UPI00214ED596|nr:titin isoform X2 [Pectinophora gossypiella]
MESSEDDAGAATNASRRASAREKDVGACEDGGASGAMLQVPAEAGGTSETASVSEEAFDADSVPSPSAQDVNTSTEAILDMIDEIVDGPDAPKRLSRGSADADADDMCTASDVPAGVPQPLSSDTDPQTSCTQTSTSESDTKGSEKSSDSPSDCVSHSKAIASDVYIGNLSEEKSELKVENASVTSANDGNSTEVSQKSPIGSQAECTLKSNLTECDTGVEPVTTKNAQLDNPPHQADLPNAISEPTVRESNQHKSVSPSEEIPANLITENLLHENTNKVVSQSISEINLHVESPQASSSLAGNVAAESTSEETVMCSEEKPSSLPPNIPSSSVAESISNLTDSSENQICERTIKCVTSSDNRDNVTVESAESTSSDTSVSEGRAVTSESMTRSPLRRRLVRPAPSDRRPDSTVSSTVDTQNVNVDTSEQTTSDSVAKDVSSSSDAVPSVYGNVKPQEIRNLGEISVCKAETSISPPKKIKLVRQKIAASSAQRDIIDEKPVLTPDSEQCQSTSSEYTPSSLLDTALETSPTSKAENVVQNLCNEVVSNDPPANLTTSISVSSEKKVQEVVTQESSSQPVPPEVHKNESDDQKKVTPITFNLSISKETCSTESKSDCVDEGTSSTSIVKEVSDCTKQVPKLTIKLGNIQTEEPKSPIPKLTIKPIKPPLESEDFKRESSEQIPSVTKLNIKPILKPPEKINDIHRKSSSSEISESEYSENDESNSTSDQASNSDQGPSDVVPKVTIKVGKPGTDSEGKFYTEQNVPKLLIKSIPHNENEEQESVSKLKLVISQPDDNQSEKIPKLTIKSVAKSEGQPLSPKLTIKPLKPLETVKKDCLTESAMDFEIPKITIKPVVKTDTESSSKTPRKSTVVCDSLEHIPVVTKLNIKPILKPTECETENLEERVPVVSKLNIKPIVKPTDPSETAEEVESQVPVVSKLNIKPILKPAEVEASEAKEQNVPVVSKLNIKPILKPSETSEASESLGEKVPVVSKLNIKPVIKPKDNEIQSSVEDIPKVTKLNIKPLRNPEEKSSDEKDCDELNDDTERNSIPVVTKINIKPIIKPVDEDTSKDSENQSSETGNSSDDNTDHIPVVTKINIKPIIKPNDTEELSKPSEENIPVITKLNIKPLIKPEESKSPSSPKKENVKITKLNIKPVLKPEEIEQQKSNIDSEDVSTKNPPLVMKINIKTVTDIPFKETLSDEDRKVNSSDDNSEYKPNNIDENIPKVSKLNIKPIVKPSKSDDLQGVSSNMTQVVMNCKPSSSHLYMTETPKQNCVSIVNEDPKFDKHTEKSGNQNEPSTTHKQIPSSDIAIDFTTKPAQSKESNTKLGDICNRTIMESFNQVPTKPHSSLQNCTLLKKLLETKKDGLDKRLDENRINANHSIPIRTESNIIKVDMSCEQHYREKNNSKGHENEITIPPSTDQSKVNDIHVSIEQVPAESIHKEPGEHVTRPLEINISDKISTQSSGQDSPRIILKINKTDHGPSAKIITEEPKGPGTPQQNDGSENTQEVVNDKQSHKKVVNSRKKPLADTPTMPMGKRLRSSRIVENTEKSPVVKKYTGKRPSTTDTSPPQSKEPELSVLETKRLKLGQLLSSKSLGTPVPAKVTQVSPTKTNVETKQAGKIVNHSLLINENCSKNGNSKLHNILSNLQAKQAQALAFNDMNCAEKTPILPELESNASTGSSDVVEVVPVENSHPEVQEMIINENSESHDFPPTSDELSQDPLEVDAPKPAEPPVEAMSAPPPVQLTPQPKKRGRPRKLPVSEGAKPAPVLPVPALEERPQRSLRLSREQPRHPTILAKPRGRGRGRGRRAEPDPPREEPAVEAANKFFVDEKPEDIDPTSSRIKLPRMTEALDKMPSSCTTPLSSRRRNSSTSDIKLFETEPKVVLNMLPKMEEPVTSPETPARGTRGGRGSRGGRGRTPRSGRGRGRGGGRGAMYMKETMGIYGRVCGPATTTVQLFEEETCMMDDNATPAKPSHLLDEDSQSSVKSSTNDSSKMKKSKFADLFDSNKVWTAADVKEYMWPPPETPDVEHQVMMIQEQVAMFLGVKSFKRRYPELKRRPVCGEERDYVLSKGIVTEALCDLGITAVDASEVLDIMLSDYPHKYEEYRAHQRQRQLAAAVDEPDTKTERVDRVEMKPEVKPVETKPEPPKVDLEKTRQEALAAAIASASEFNSRMNVSRRGACVDLQSHTVQRRRAPPPRPREHVRPPAGFYPHALLPGQYQHSYRVYTPDQLRYFPLNTVMSAPAAPASPAPSDSDSEPDWRSDSSSDDSARDRPAAKRKKLTKTKRSSGAEAVKEEVRDEETCRVCKLRLEANRKYTHERFLVCANCNAKLHPGCTELGADTVRKAREYAWQCAECKACGTCGAPGEDDKLLFCDLCDRGFHCYCVGLPAVPAGRWHCVECAICKSCGARSPGGGGGGSSTEPATWHHQTRRGPGGHKVYSHSLCTPCARVR